MMSFRLDLLPLQHVNTGLIENWVGYQEELNFVLAHEMAHHIANHINDMITIKILVKLHIEKEKSRCFKTQST